MKKASKSHKRKLDYVFRCRCTVSREEAEARLRAALEATDYSVPETAKILGLDGRTIYRWLEVLGMRSHYDLMRKACLYDGGSTVTHVDFRVSKSPSVLVVGDEEDAMGADHSGGGS